MKAFDSALYGLCGNLKMVLSRIRQSDKEQIFEIRLRTNRPVMLSMPQGCVYIATDGTLRFTFTSDCLIATADDLRASFDLLCEHSYQTHENELKHGYISMKCGHRAGVGGEGVMQDGGVVTFRRITSLNIRIARSISGTAVPVMRSLYDRFGHLPGTLIYGPPGCGKTTLLRDMAAQLAKAGHRVTLIDQKGELSGVGEVADYDLLTGIDKATAAEMAVRNLNPEYILFDEIGNEEEAKQIQNCLNCGVTVITTLHAGDPEELARRPIARRLAKMGAIRGGVYLRNVGCVAEVLNMEEMGENTGHFDPVCGGGADEFAEKPIS